MSLIVELKITNLSDWAIIQPLLKRLKISFVQKPIQKEVKQNQMASEPPVLYSESSTVFQQESQTPIWSPYDSYDAAEILLNAMKNNAHQI